MRTFIAIIRWTLQKFAGGVLIVGLALAAGGVWLYLKDNVDIAVWQEDLVRTISGEQAKIRAAMADVNQRLGRLAAEIAAAEERTKTADKVIARLKELESTWDRLVGNRAQQKANAEQLEKMTRLRTASAEKKQRLAGVVFVVVAEP